MIIRTIILSFSFFVFSQLSLLALVGWTPFSDQKDVQIGYAGVVSLALFLVLLVCGFSLRPMR